MNIRNDNIQPFKYNGKEFDMMHGLYTYDYGARQYNPVVPSWDRMDPLGEAFQDVSPFAYCHNNPVNYIDINGMFDTQDEAVDYANSHYVGLSNAYALRDGTGRYINSATPTFRLGNIDIDFSLRGANAMAKGIKYLGFAGGIASLVMTGYEISEGKKNIIGEGGLDFIMTGVGVLPGYGWAISSAYFFGKSALEYSDLDFWNK